MDFGQLVGGLGTLYMGNKSQKGYDQLQNNLQNLYGPNSPYAQNMRAQLERKDAAAGRRSQYGPREVELQSNLANAYSKNAPAMLATMNQGNANRNTTINGVLQLLKQNGAFGGLDNLFSSSPLASLGGAMSGIGALDSIGALGLGGFDAGIGGLGSLFGLGNIGGEGDGWGQKLGSIGGSLFGGPIGGPIGSFFGSILDGIF